MGKEEGVDPFGRRRGELDGVIPSCCLPCFTRACMQRNNRAVLCMLRKKDDHHVHQRLESRKGMEFVKTGTGRFTVKPRQSSRMNGC